MQGPRPGCKAATNGASREGTWLRRWAGVVAASMLHPLQRKQEKCTNCVRSHLSREQTIQSLHSPDPRGPRVSRVGGRPLLWDHYGGMEASSPQGSRRREEAGRGTLREGACVGPLYIRKRKTRESICDPPHIHFSFRTTLQVGILENIIWDSV